MKRKYRVIKHIRPKHKYEYVFLVQMKIFLWWITVKEFEVQMYRFDSKQVLYTQLCALELIDELNKDIQIKCEKINQFKKQIAENAKEPEK